MHGPLAGTKNPFGIIRVDLLNLILDSRQRESSEVLDVVCDPFGCRLEAAESVEVQLDAAVLRGVETRLKVADEVLRAGLAEQVGDRQAVLLRDRRGRGEAEPRGEAEQQLDAGRAGDGDEDPRVGA